MVAAFLVQAMRSRQRQRTLRQLAVAQAVVAATCTIVAYASGDLAATGNGLIVTGIVEGAVLIGWRLSQLPKSQALEPVLGSPIGSVGTFMGETIAGLGLFGLVTVAGLPPLFLLVIAGKADLTDLGAMLVMPWTWGAVTGMGLTMWAYESAGVRRWGERIFLIWLAIYLGIGLVAGEHLRQWIDRLPADLARALLVGFDTTHRFQPFAVLAQRLGGPPGQAWDHDMLLELGASVVIVCLFLRAAVRFKPHFDDLHHEPGVLSAGNRRKAIGTRPLSWWAVHRVARYSGRANLWLAASFGGAYALYLLAEPVWPRWLGRQVFVIFERWGGFAVVATALVLLGAVPAIFQYGLWDSNVRERCRRLELLILTRLEGRDYWQAAAAAAWRRSRGYLAVALGLWLAAYLSGRIGLEQLLAAIAGATVLWGLYFAVGFQAFARGIHANALGLVATLGMPLAVWLGIVMGWGTFAWLLPPGFVYAPAATPGQSGWLLGILAWGVTALFLARAGLAQCDRQLRAWYSRQHGRMTAE
jgi:hypothetical protein